MGIEANTINIGIKYIYFQKKIDAQVKAIMTVHWAGFALAQHSLTEPKENLKYIVPQLGVVALISNVTASTFWFK